MDSYRSQIYLSVAAHHAAFAAATANDSRSGSQIVQVAGSLNKHARPEVGSFIIQVGGAIVPCWVFGRRCAPLIARSRHHHRRRRRLCELSVGGWGANMRAQSSLVQDGRRCKN